MKCHRDSKCIQFYYFQTSTKFIAGVAETFRVRKTSKTNEPGFRGRFLKLRKD